MIISAINMPNGKQNLAKVPPPIGKISVCFSGIALGGIRKIAHSG